MTLAMFVSFEVAGCVVAVLVATVCTMLRSDASPRLWLLWAGCVFGFVTSVAAVVKLTWWLGATA